MVTPNGSSRCKLKELDYEYDQGSRSNPTSPEFHNSCLTECRDYIIKDVTRRLREELMRDLDRDFGIVEESLKITVSNRVPRLLDDAFKAFQRQRHRPGPGLSRPDQPTDPQTNLPGQDVTVPDEPRDTGDEDSEFSITQELFGQDGKLSSVGFGFETIDPFTFLEEPDVSFNHSSGLMGNLLQHSAGPSGSGGENDMHQEGQQLSDSGYVGSSPHTQSPEQQRRDIP
jgi:hypothetical protein